MKKILRSHIQKQCIKLRLPYIWVILFASLCSSCILGQLSSGISEEKTKAVDRKVAEDGYYRDLEQTCMDILPREEYDVLGKSGLWSFRALGYFLETKTKDHELQKLIRRRLESKDWKRISKDDRPLADEEYVREDRAIALDYLISESDVFAVCGPNSKGFLESIPDPIPANR